MKKILLFVAFLLVGFLNGIQNGYSYTGFVEDEGVEYSTSVFSDAEILVPVLTTGAWIYVHGVKFSSGSDNAFVLLQDSGTNNGYTVTARGQGYDVMRVYNSSETGTSQVFVNREFWFPKPIVLKRGLVWRASTAAYHIVTVFYHRRRTP